MKKYEFSNYEHIKEHGKAPKGTGHWAFVIKNAKVQGLAPEVMFDQVSAYRTDTTFWVPGVWTLTEAKKRAAVMLEACAVPFGVTIYVAP